jgi:hypothetical protein
MEKYFEEFINNRCEHVLNNNPTYIELHKKLAETYDKKDIDAYCEIASEMRLFTENISYTLAIKDLLKFSLK